MITVIGLDGSPLTQQAQEAIGAATLVVGGRRHLAAALPAGTTVRTLPLGPLTPAIDALADHDGDAVVLASGDPGFFGIVRALRRKGLACTVWPAVSSVSLAFARAGLSWEDAVVVSAHGRDVRRAANVCRAHPKVAVLTGPGHGPAELGAALDGWPRRLLVAEWLGEPGERVTECTPAVARQRDWDEPNVVLVIAARADSADSADSRDLSWSWPPWSADHQAGWALDEAAFAHRDSQITKPEVRALALARLAPGPGMLIWDVGSGCGSVAVECGRFGAAVIAVERDPDQCARVSANARRHDVDVRVINGEAPAVLGGLPDPDSVFIGGGGPAVVDAVAGRQPARIVVSLAAIERAGPVRTALARAGYGVNGTLLQSARFSPLPGDVHRLAAQNPVFLLWAGYRGPEAQP